MSSETGYSALVPRAAVGGAKGTSSTRHLVLTYHSGCEEICRHPSVHRCMRTGNTYWRNCPPEGVHHDETVSDHTAVRPRPFYVGVLSFLAFQWHPLQSAAVISTTDIKL